jgi:hypothetical protein
MAFDWHCPHGYEFSICISSSVRQDDAMTEEFGDWLYQDLMMVSWIAGQQSAKARLHHEADCQVHGLNVVHVDPHNCHR